MSKDETPPFPRGATYYNGGTIDTSNLGGGNLLGKEWKIEDTTYGTNQYVTIRAMRNTGAATLLPGRLCQFDPLYPSTAINGYTTLNYQPGVLLDEFLIGGLLANDIGYVVIQGPALFWSPLDGGADNVVAFLDPVAALTAVTSGATTAGRLATATTAGATTNQRDSLLNVVGRALSAKTTGNTNAQVLVNVQRLF